MPTAAEETPEPSAGLRERATHGVMWAAAEKWMVRTSTLVGFVLLGRLLGPEEFGIVALAMVFISLLTVVTDGGATLFLLQRRELDPTVKSTAFYLSGALGLVLGPALALTAPWIADVLDAAALNEVLPALAVALVLAALSNVPASLLQRDLRFRELAMRQVLATVLSVITAVTLALAGAGVWALVAQTLVRSAVSFVMLWIATDFRPARLFSRGVAQEMLSFGGKVMGGEILRRARVEGETLLIGVLAGTTAVGLWSVALRLVDVITDLCSSVFGRVAHPVFARLQDDSARLGRALGTSMAMAGSVMVPMLVLLALTSEVVVPAVFGAQWVAAAGVAAVLAIRSIAVALLDFHRSVLLATGHAGTELVATVVHVGVQLALVVVFVDEGLTTLAVVLSLWAVAVWPLRAVLLRRIHGIRARTYGQTAVVLLAAGVAAGAVLVADRSLSLSGWAYVATAFGLGAAVYLTVVLLAARGLAREVVAALPGPLRSLGRRGRPA